MLRLALKACTKGRQQSLVTRFAVPVERSLVLSELFPRRLFICLFVGAYWKELEFAERVRKGQETKRHVYEFKSSEKGLENEDENKLNECKCSPKSKLVR